MVVAHWPRLALVVLPTAQLLLKAATVAGLMLTVGRVVLLLTGHIQMRGWLRVLSREATEVTLRHVVGMVVRQRRRRQVALRPLVAKQDKLFHKAVVAQQVVPMAMAVMPWPLEETVACQQQLAKTVTPAKMVIPPKQLVVVVAGP